MGVVAAAMESNDMISQMPMEPPPEMMEQPQIMPPEMMPPEGAMQ